MPRRVLLSAGVALLALSVAVPAAAGTATEAPGGDPAAEASGPGEVTARTWGVVPSGPGGPDGRAAFEYRLDPGQGVEDTVRVANYSEQELTLDLYARDAVTTGDGGFDLLARDEGSRGAGQWIVLAEDRVTVAARSWLDVPFRVTVPADATPGDHPGGIVATATTAGDGVALESRVGARVYLRVAGELAPALAVEDLVVDYEESLLPFRPGRVTVTYRVADTGNTRLGVRAVAGSAGPRGLLARDGGPVTVTEIVPGGRVEVVDEVEGVWPTGWTRVRVAAEAVPAPGDDLGAAGPLSVAVASARVWTVPWSQLAVLAVAVLIAAVLLRRRSGRRRPGEAPGPDTSPDTDPAPDPGTSPDADSAPDAGPAPDPDTAPERQETRA